MPLASCSPLAAIRLGASRRLSSRSVARLAAKAVASYQKVPMAATELMASLSASLPTSADSGWPLAIALLRQTRSGVNPKYSLEPRRSRRTRSARHR
jgi:hypothetical protein